MPDDSTSSPASPDSRRYRVTGTIFLIAVAVIVLPMIFDGAGVETPQLPPVPEVEVMAPVTPLSEVAPATDTLRRVDEFRAEVDEDGYNVETETIFGAPVLDEDVTDATAWAIQLGSFAEEPNARALRERLHADGYNALLSHTRSNGQQLVRVAIGPFLEREAADALVEKLQSDYDLDPQVVAFSH